MTVAEADMKLFGSSNNVVGSIRCAGGSRLRCVLEGAAWDGRLLEFQNGRGLMNLHRNNGFVPSRSGASPHCLQQVAVHGGVQRRGFESS